MCSDDSIDELGYPSNLVLDVAPSLTQDVTYNWIYFENTKHFSKLCPEDEFVLCDNFIMWNICIFIFYQYMELTE